jgi:hypothetical protein
VSAVSNLVRYTLRNQSTPNERATKSDPVKHFFYCQMASSSSASASSSRKLSSLEIRLHQSALHAGRVRVPFSYSGSFIYTLITSMRSLFSKMKSTRSLPNPMHEQMLSISSLRLYVWFICSYISAEWVASGPFQIDERGKWESFISCCPKK